MLPDTSGNTSNAFALNLQSGALTVNNEAAVDFETNPVFTLGVSVSDGLLVSYATITVNVTDAAENSAPVLVAAAPDAAIAEDAVDAVIVADVASLFDDPDNDPLTFAASSSNDQISVQIVNNALRATPSANYFGQAVITLTASDGSLSAEDSLTLVVTSVNDAPVFTLSRILVDLGENFTTTETVSVVPGTVPANELDQSITYSLTPASVTFANVTINNTTGQVSIQSVEGGGGTQQFTVTGNDGQPANATATATFTLHVRLITALEQNPSAIVEVYPNPATNYVHIKTSLGEYMIEVIDGNGGVVASSAGQGMGATVDITGLRSGLYVVKIKSGNATYHRKLLVH